MTLSLNRMSERAREYFGGDCYDIYLERVRRDDKGYQYILTQVRNYYGNRDIVFYADNAREAIKQINADASNSDDNHY